MRFLHLLPILLITKVFAAEFVAPSTWEGTNITASAAERQTTIEAAIQVVFDNGTTSASDDFFSILALYDLYNNQTSFQGSVTAYFASTPFATSSFTNTAIDQGLSAIRAYQVYQDSSMLQVATAAWAFGRSFTISAANVAAGSIPSKSFNFTKTCSGATLAGGTFWQTDPTNPDIFGASTVIFFTLSAYLYQATANNTYLSAAQDSGAFMVDIMNITQVKNGIGAMSVNDSASCGDIFGGGNFEIDNAGWFIEGLAVLPNDTTFGLQELSVEAMRSNAVNITLTTNSLCNATNGIINTGGGVGEFPLVQGLGTLYHAIRNTGPANLVTYIGNFLSVQYNTIVTKAAEPNTSIYAGSWIGPPVTQYDPGNQTLALYALVNAAQVNPTESNSTTNGTDPSPSPGGNNSSDRTTSHTGAIVGAVVGVLVLLAAIALVLFFTIRRRRRRYQTKGIDPNFSIDALYTTENQPSSFQSQHLTTDSSNPTMSSPTPNSPNALYNPYSNTSSNGNGYGVYTGKGPLPMQMQVTNRGRGESRSTDPISENPPSSTTSQRLEQIPTSDLLQLLQTRIQQEGRPEQGTAPPAYDVSGSE